jgi:hypothetical protein
MSDRLLTTARDVSEYLLEKTGEAMLAGDMDAFAQNFLLPQDIDTFDGRLRVDTVEEVKEVARNVRAHFMSKGVTEMVRHCIDAHFRDEKTVEATHETRLLSGTQLVQAPFPVFSVLKHTETGWKIASSQYAITDEPAHNAALTGRPSRRDQPE